jgi:hypothetical protein
MCKPYMEGSRCPQGGKEHCPYAHGPLELDLVKLEANIKNLQGVANSESMKLKDMKPLEPWKPAKSGISHGKNYLITFQANLEEEMFKKKKKKNDGDDENSPKKRKTEENIFEREDIRKMPFEAE